MGPERWGRDYEEWVIHFHYPVDCAESDAQVEADARKALGIGDLPTKIHRITRWSVEAVIASAFKVGRVLRLGDAAHRHPPTGGLGLTSAIPDAQSLCWKVTAVLNGYAPPALLDTYEAERRPVDQRNCQRSLENAVNHFAIGSELGYGYNSAAGVRDGTPAPVQLDDIRIYEPSTRPGAPLPHGWIDDEDAAAGRSRTSSSPGGSCSSPARTARPGARRPGTRCRGRTSARRVADRSPRRRSLRPALRVGAPAPDRT
jgi:2,4-dichlorophenol 6-monooxygenase